MTIKTRHDPMDFPTREFDWSAYVDGEEEWYGVTNGATETEAINRMIERIEDRTPGALGIPDNDCRECGRLLMPSGKCSNGCTTTTEGT